jgi:methyltransferase (TIGR00027 family)
MKADRPSATARTIALGTVLLKADPRFGRLVSPEAAETCRAFLEAASPRGLNLARLCDRSWFRAFMGWMERATLPGLRLHYSLRKRFIEEVARRSLGEGTRQLVVLGGGFDTLALRLHPEFPERRFIEIDHPATQRIKLKALEGRRAPGPNLRLVPADFTRETLEEVLLNRTPFDPGLRTLFVMEGVLMYLEVEDIDRIFSFVRRRSPAGSRFAFTFMTLRPGGRLGFARSSPLVDTWLRLMGEPFRWGLRRDDLAGFLRSRGLELEELATPETFRRVYLEPEGMGTPVLAEGECVAVARVP